MDKLIFARGMVDSETYVVQSPDYSHRIYRSSFLILVSATWATWCDVATGMLFSLLVFVTSQIYWWNPTPGWRRNADMICVAGSISHHVVYLVPLTTWYYQYAYYLAMVLTGYFYQTARYYGRVKQDYNRSSWAHVLLHLVGNLGNILLYTGVRDSY